MRIFINPGHGGLDSGAVGNGLKERDVVLDIGRRVEKYLRAVGYEVKLFQYDGLGAICDDANGFGADLFVSIHCNAGGGAGVETYSSGGSKSLRLAGLIQRQVVDSVGFKDRGVKVGNLYVLKYTEAPAVLVECGFIDNAADAKILVERADDIARAVARGVSDYYSADKAMPAEVKVGGSLGQLSAHFSSSEFECPCCGVGGDRISARLIDLLERLRGECNAPIHINSGYRCERHNRAIGGVANSQHLSGLAADIYIPALTFDKAAALVRQFPFDAIGYYPPIAGLWFIHVDVRDGAIASLIEWWN